MNITLAQSQDAPAIANIHKTEISGGFLSSLPEAFLEKFYEAIILSPVSFCVVAKENNQVVGFVAGTTDISTFYRYFFTHYFFQSFFIVLPKLFSSFKKIAETLLYPTKEKALPKAELLTIAVKKEFQGRGIAGQMFKEFTAEMRKRNIKEFKVLVGANLPQAIHFYEKNGFRFVKNTSVHGKAVSKIYVYTL